jgi:hypothetical protein
LFGFLLLFSLQNNDYNCFKDVFKRLTNTLHVACVLAEVRNRNTDEEATITTVERIVDETDTKIDEITAPTATAADTAGVQPNKPPPKKLSMS